MRSRSLVHDAITMLHVKTELRLPSNIPRNAFRLPDHMQRDHNGKILRSTDHDHGIIDHGYWRIG